jgi:eukaryotic-like serine/threonine-protein kinase
VGEETETHLSAIGGRYDLLEVIGSGGSAVVWRAYDQNLRRQVACKILSMSLVHDPVFRKRFQREARHVASLSHPNIVRIYDFGIDNERPFIVMEYVAGSSLRPVLNPDAPLSISATAAIAVETLAALEHAHASGIVHRDIKPANLLLDRNGHIKVTDFGIAKSTGETTDLTLGGAFMGTAAFASPEQLAGGSVGPASDLYSLGCVLYECVTGRAPFQGGSPELLIYQRRYADPPVLAEVRPDIPVEISSAITRAMANDPSDRFLNAREMLDCFAPYAASSDLSLLIDSSLSNVGDDDATAPEADPFSAGLSSPVESPTRHGSVPYERQSKRQPVHRLLALGIAALLIAGAAFAITKIVQSHHAGSQSEITSGGFLQPGHSITSPNGQFSVTMQLDGNLVDYRIHGKSPMWQSGTSGNFNAYVVMQPDGDLVIYPPGKSAPAPGQLTDALWSSGSSGHPNASAELLNSGEFLVRSHTSNAIVWRIPLRPAG